MWKSVAAVSVGGTLGCLFRWWLALQLNRLFPSIPPGTLAANLIGGYIIGVAIGYFAINEAVPPEWRLFVMTGFCGGLTTFSTFSAEVFTLLAQTQIGFAIVEIGVHMLGSLAATALGVLTIRWTSGIG
ncbi:MAG TPA: fluoride efflux transporter CrcB [Steroidobacteraceae bacterium]|nr:fluoride efflux transporter CrcB [Steroidobacteraceae bacterium]